VGRVESYTHIVVHVITQLDGLVIVVIVDGIQSVHDIWAKLRRTYAGVEKNMHVFQIK
jgi:hypothetical protein